MASLIEGKRERSGSVQELREKIWELQFQTLNSVAPSHFRRLQGSWRGFMARVFGVEGGEEGQEEEYEEKSDDEDEDEKVAAFWGV
ncbi:hypothetical protein TWF481_009884 [Arthrobotrys musiformis]|uniref:Uncharacterized protein n=1 Tax=Arthrobotrys musiformis TaxID=47236 RepID=A0AAV9W681_9PEZI